MEEGGGTIAVTAKHGRTAVDPQNALLGMQLMKGIGKATGATAQIKPEPR